MKLKKRETNRILFDVVVVDAVGFGRCACWAAQLSEFLIVFVDKVWVFPFFSCFCCCLKIKYNNNIKLNQIIQQNKNKYTSLLYYINI